MAQNSTIAGAKAVTRISLRSIVAHKIRLLLTVVAVVLGTAFIAGSLMFTDSLSRTFDSIVDGQMKEVHAVVDAAPRNNDDQPQAGPATPAQQPRGMSEDTVRSILDRPDVNRVNLADDLDAIIATEEGQAIQTGGAPTMLRPFYTGEESVAGENSLTDGSAPHGPKEVVLNETAADKHNIDVGDTLRLVTTSERDRVVVTGLYSSDLDTGGFIGVGMDPEAFLDSYLPGKKPTTLYVEAATGTSAHELVDNLAAEYQQFSVKTGQEVSEEISEQINKALSFVSYFLVAFGLVGLLVGTFIIANTFSMIVAQRMREFALLRALGVSRRQLTASVVLESLIVGLIGSAIGVLAGAGLVKAIYAMLAATGAGLPDSGISLTTQAVAVPVVLGVIVTIISAWAPARRAGSVEPVEAMRSGDSTSSSSLVVRTAFGIFALVLGIGLALLGSLAGEWTTKLRAISVGFAALFTLIGAFLASPAISRLVVPAIGRVIGAPFGVAGVLARKNSQRNPRRTATTAFALTLGLALVAVIGMLGMSMKASVSSVTESAVKADLIATAPMETGFPIPNDAVEAIENTDGVDAMLTVGMSNVTVENKSTFPGMPAASYLDGSPTKSIAMETVMGQTDLKEGGFIADTQFAAENGWVVGKSYPLTMRGQELPGQPARLVGTYEPNQVMGPYALSDASIKAAMGEETEPGYTRQIQAVMVNGADGLDADTLQERLTDATEDFVVVQVMTPQEFSGQAAIMVDQMLNILYAMLALAIIVAILGIINTLALNVIERRQEVGMLRAIGTMRGQIRRMITLEAVQIAVYGALVGIVIGLGLGWSFATVLQDEGLDSIQVPWGQLGWMILGSAVVGIVAAVWPAIKASRTPPLEAIAD